MLLLRKIFEGVAVDGSTSYVPTQGAAPPDRDNDYNDDNEDDDDFYEIPEDSRANTGSHKRGSSTSTTGTSPCKETKSPIVKIFNLILAQNTKLSEQRTAFLQEQATFDREQTRLQRLQQQQTMERKKGDLATIKKMALEAGVAKNSVQFYALGYLGKDEEMKNLFMDLETGPERVQFLRRFCRDHNLE